MINSYVKHAYMAAVLLFLAARVGAEAIVARVPVGTMPNDIALDSVTNKIYVANYGSNTVTVIDGASNTTTTLAVGSYPRFIAVNPATHKIYVANTGSNNVTVIDGATNATTTVNTDTLPYAIAVNPVTNRIYVANCHGRNSTITVIDGATNATETVAIEQSPDFYPDPMILAVNPVTDKVYFGCADTNFITVLDGVTNKIKNIVIGPLTEDHRGVCDIGINMVTDNIFLACTDGSVKVIDGATNDISTIINRMATFAGSSRLTVNPVTNKVYAAMSLFTYRIYVVEINGETYDTVGVASFLGANGPIAVNPVNGKIYILYSGGVGGAPPGLEIINGETKAITILPLVNFPHYIAINSTTGMVYTVDPADSSVTVVNGATPSAVTLVLPADDDPNVVLTPTFKWDSLPFSGSRYTVQVSTERSFTATVINDTTASDSLLSPVSLSVGTKYYWRVGAINSNGSGPWTIDSFTTAIVIPSSPAMISPVHGATGVELNAKLTWNRSYGAEAYRVQLSASSSLTTVTDTLLSDTLLAVSLVPLTVYYWRVNASNSHGTSSWTTLDSFFTPPLPPKVVSPLNGDTDVPLNSQFSWQSCAGAETYRVQVCTSSTFQTAYDTLVLDTFLTSAPLLPNYTYTWRVNAGNAIYGFSSWSMVDSFFTILATPSIPVLTNPPNGSKTNPFVPANVKLEWEKCPGAAKYNVQVSTSPEFSDFFDTTVTEPYWIISSRISHTATYNWRVNAQNAAGTSDWSTVNSFTVLKLGVLLPIPLHNRMTYNGMLLIYSLNGRLVKKTPFTALAAKNDLLISVQKRLAQGAYFYCFMQDRKVMDMGRIVVK